jgi:hypothetical protein
MAVVDLHPIGIGGRDEGLIDAGAVQVRAPDRSVLAVDPVDERFGPRASLRD